MARGGTPGNKGGGRIGIDGARGVIPISVTIEPHQKAQLAALGGSAFVRRAIKDAIDRAPTGQQPGPSN